MFVCLNYFQIMATSNNNTDSIDLENLKIEESTTVKSEISASRTKSKKEKPKTETTPAAPVEELDFNRTPEEVVEALEQWSKKPSTLNKLKPDEKMYKLISLYLFDFMFFFFLVR